MCGADPSGLDQAVVCGLGELTQNSGAVGGAVLAEGGAQLVNPDLTRQRGAQLRGDLLIGEVRRIEGADFDAVPTGARRQT